MNRTKNTEVKTLPKAVFPFICPTCGKTYTRRQGLWRHRRRVHGSVSVSTVSEPIDSVVVMSDVELESSIDVLSTAVAGLETFLPETSSAVVSSLTAPLVCPPSVVESVAVNFVGEPSIEATLSYQSASSVDPPFSFSAVQGPPPNPNDVSVAPDMENQSNTDIQSPNPNLPTRRYVAKKRIHMASPRSAQNIIADQIAARWFPPSSFSSESVCRMVVDLPHESAFDIAQTAGRRFGLQQNQQSALRRRLSVAVAMESHIINELRRLLPDDQSGHSGNDALAFLQMVRTLIERHDQRPPLMVNE